MQPLSLQPITAQEIGCVVINLSYDNASGGDVYFDDLKITVTDRAQVRRKKREAAVDLRSE